MYRQMEIFDFIEKPLGSEWKPHRSQFEQIFEKVSDPVSLCVNCLCEYCANNVEQLWIKVRPEEMLEPCFNCDECFEYTGETGHKDCDQKNCDKFILSDHGAKRKRRRIRLIKI